MADGDELILGSEDNNANNRTSLTKNQGFLPVLDLFNDDGVGLLIIAGESTFHSGGPVAQGEALAAFSPGTAVVGTGGVSGVFASGAESGVEAHCDAGVGVRGHSQTGTGVFGQSSSGPGVHADSSTGLGVYANSVQRSGVYAYSARVSGVYGRSGRSIGVLGVAEETGTGIVGFSRSGFGGEFYGPVRVFGDFTVIGGIKSAAVPHADGSYRQLYALESPECWFEDFGRAVLRQGKATVKLRPDFAAVIDDKDMHIFLTPEGDSNGLYVSRMGAADFSVRELQGGTSKLNFSYRIVGRRKDLQCQRMKKISVPQHPRMPEAEPAVIKTKPRKARELSFYKPKSNA